MKYIQNSTVYHENSIQSVRYRQQNGAVALANIFAGGSPVLYPNGIEIDCGFDAILYKCSSFIDIPFGMEWLHLIRLYAVIIILFYITV